MSTLTLFGTQGSGSAAIEAALTLAKLPFEQVDAASWHPGPGLEALSRVNPLQQIPTLVLDNGTVLTESAAILIELGLRHPESGLLPSQPTARARAIRGLVFVAANCYAAISIIDYPARWCVGADDDDVERIRAGSRERLHRHWSLFAEQFGANFMAGGRPGALELLATVVSKWSGSRPHLQQARPEFHALLLTVEQHPAVADILPVTGRLEEKASMFAELQDALGNYLLPFLIAVPLAIVVILISFRKGEDTLVERPPRVEPMAPPPAPAVPQTRSPAAVLVVDDSTVARTKLVKLFNEAGYLVASAKDGVEALEVLSRQKVDVLVTDLEMPNKDGFELIADVKGSLATEDLPIIAITGHEELQTRVHEVQGLFGIFKKPWNDRELLKRVEALASLRKA